jgi:hypothetical protein
VFESRVLRYNEHHDLYSSPNIIQVNKSRIMSLGGHVADIGEKRNAYRILMGQAKRKRQLARSKRRWEDNIKVDLQVIWWEGVDWNEGA